MTKILLVTHYFPPEVGAPQARLSEMAETWAEDGAIVTVLTGMPNHPTGVVPPEYRRSVFKKEQRGQYRLLRTWLYATPNEGFLKKTLGHLSFMITSVVIGGWRTGPVDVVVVSSPTFFSIASAWFLSKVRRARLVVEVRDLWPAIFVELGVLTQPTVIRVLERFELAAYRAADAVVVVSEGFRDHIVGRGIPSDRVHTIRNGVDLRRFSSGTPDTGVRAGLGADPDDALVLYLGAHGISQGLTTVADAASLLVDSPIHITFVGEGADKQRLIDRVAELKLENVTLLSAVRREEVPELLAAADICLVPLRDVPLFSTFIPSKMFEYLGSAKAVIGSLRGESAEILRESGAVVVEPEDPEALAQAIRGLARDPEGRRIRGLKGREFVVEHFDRTKLARRYLAIIESLSKKRSL